MESSLTLKFRGAEAELLDRHVRSGLFTTKSEALRASSVKFGADLGLLRARDLWPPSMHNRAAGPRPRNFGSRSRTPSMLTSAVPSTDSCSPLNDRD